MTATNAGVSTVAGAKLYIGTTATDGTEDTFTEVAEITNIPAFGRTYNVVKYNPLSTRGTQKFKGSYDDGTVAIQLGKDLTDEGQQAVVAALDIDADYNFKVVDNDSVPAETATVTITTATPAVVTWAGSNLPAGSAVKLGGAVPTGLTAGTTYYVVNPTADTFELAATQGGDPINTTEDGTGTYTATTIPADSFQIFKAKVTSYTTTRGTVDNVITATATLDIKSGSIIEQVHLP